MLVTSDAPSSESGEAALWEPRYHQPVVTGFLLSNCFQLSREEFEIMILSFRKLDGSRMTYSANVFFVLANQLCPHFSTGGVVNESEGFPFDRSAG